MALKFDKRVFVFRFTLPELSLGAGSVGLRGTELLQVYHISPYRKRFLRKFDLRNFLKWLDMDSAELDAIVHRITDMDFIRCRLIVRARAAKRGAR